jgi:GR25 family glycosyltransferase involved in LPS biosynthesis
MSNTNTFIIHVSTAIERERHMLQQISGRNLSYQFILDGDKDQLNEKILEKYFSGNMRQISNGTSCAYKHILAYENMIENNIEQALVLEDDIELDVHFEDFLGKIYDEIDRNNISNYLISLEDSNLKYVKGSERKHDQILYPKKMGRMAGAYLIDLKAAMNMVHEINQHKCSLPIDWFHNLCSEKKILNIWWAHPAIACQGSLSGSIKSLIDDKPANYFRRLSFKLQKFYKKIIYSLR